MREPRALVRVVAGVLACGALVLGGATTPADAASQTTVHTVRDTGWRVAAKHHHARHLALRDSGWRASTVKDTGW